MCGIVGYFGQDEAAPALIDGLYRLEYRGYDSAGIAVLHHGFTIVKRKGRVRELEGARTLRGNIGIGHTRWATHGEPSEKNAHPHRYRNVVLVHNGIIENASVLKAELTKKGEVFSSDTDSEVVAHLIADEYQGDLLLAVKNACARLEGSYALAVMCEEEECIVCARKNSPLIVARAARALLVSSDLSALSGVGVKAYPLGENEFASLQKNSLVLYDNNLQKIQKKAIEGETNEERGDCDFPHKMRKEMAEIPLSIQKTLEEFEKSDVCEVLCHAEYIQMVACGTAYHACLCGKRAIERLARIPVEVFVASEYRYLDPIVRKNTVLLAVSQSGETADTLAAVRLAKERGAKVVAVTNVPSSSLPRLADFSFFTRAGREEAVAATKSFNAQLAVLFPIARRLALLRGDAPALPDFASLAEETLRRSEVVRSWTGAFLHANVALFIGRGEDADIALEGSLKLKEISYLPSEGHPAGELKHGTLALVEEGTPVVALLTNSRLAEKTMNAVHEARSRGAHVFIVTTLPAYAEGDHVLLPPCEEFASMISVIPLQMLAYYVALARGADPDKPRNLAKSVTVE